MNIIIGMVLMVMLAVLLMCRYSVYIDRASSASRVKLVLIPRRSNQAQKVASILFISEDNYKINGYLILKRSAFRYRADNSTPIKSFLHTMSS